MSTDIHHLVDLRSLGNCLVWSLSGKRKPGVGRDRHGGRQRCCTTSVLQGRRGTQYLQSKKNDSLGMTRSKCDEDGKVEVKDEREMGRVLYLSRLSILWAAWVSFLFAGCVWAVPSHTEQTSVEAMFGVILGRTFRGTLHGKAARKKWTPFKTFPARIYSAVTLLSAV